MVKYKLMNISALVSDTQILSEIQDFIILTDNHIFRIGGDEFAVLIENTEMP